MFTDLIYSVSRMGSEGPWSPCLRMDSHLGKKRPRDSCLECLPSSTPFVPPPPLFPPFTASLVLQILYNKLCPSLVWNLFLKFPGRNARKPVLSLCPLIHCKMLFIISYLIYLSPLQINVVKCQKLNTLESIQRCTPDLKNSSQTEFPRLDSLMEYSHGCPPWPWLL